MIVATIGTALQNLYRIESPIPAEHFLIDRKTYRRHCTAQPHLNPDCRETLLINAHDHAIDVGLYIAPDILRQLAADDPSQSLHQGNLEAACVAIEGVSHLLCTLWKLAHEIPVSLLELELQAEIDKYFVCKSWLQRQGRPGHHLMRQLFRNYALHGGMAQDEIARYHHASRLAWTFCTGVENDFLRAQRLAALRDTARSFFRMTHWQKLRTIAL